MSTHIDRDPTAEPVLAEATLRAALVHPGPPVAADRARPPRSPSAGGRC